MTEESINYTIETKLSGALLKPYASVILEPITYENIHTLKPGEWIWDDKEVEKNVHRRSLGGETLFEPIGFRQIHILDLTHFGTFNFQPFMLSHYDRVDDWRPGRAHWEYFEEGRFYKLE